MEFLSALLILGACFLIYKKLTAEKPDGNKTHYPRWSPPAEPKEDLDDFKKGR